jgi:hypothetical protein
LSLTRPTSLSSSSSNSSRAASSCSITSAIRRYWHSPRCPSASSLSGHQHVAHDRAEHRQFTATSAPSMLRESKYARHRRTCQFSILVYKKYIRVRTKYILVCDEYELVHTSSYKVQTGMYWHKLSTYSFVPDHQHIEGAYPHLQTCLPSPQGGQCQHDAAAGGAPSATCLFVPGSRFF